MSRRPAWMARLLDADGLLGPTCSKLTASASRYADARSASVSSPSRSLVAMAAASTGRSTRARRRTILAAAPQPGGGGRGVVAIPQTNDEPPARVPVGFTPIFNGKDLTGWHVSKTNHHGTTPDYRVLHGLIIATQQPIGQGGVLLTDKKYKNVEVYMEVKPDWGCDGGFWRWRVIAVKELPEAAPRK